MCLYPQLITNPKYKPNKKNGGRVPPVTDERITKVPIGCGQCMECRKQKQREWRIRITEETKVSKNGQMVSLTFTTESLKQLRQECEETKDPYKQDNEIVTIALRRFLERWRKKHKKSVKHWFITELGHGRWEHIHIHGIIWTNEKKEHINNIWQYGSIWAGYNDEPTYVNARTANYITKYVTKIDPKHKYYKPKILCSPGIGGAYTKTERAKTAYKTDEYRTETGHKMSLPIYYRNKIYTEQEREKKWIEKIDEQIRYVDKIKIDISKTQQNYINALREAQAKNEKLGYGNNQENWEEKRYEIERRSLIIKKREK